MSQLERWRWRYRDPKTGEIIRTMFQMTAEEAASYPGAERIEGSRSVLYAQDPEDTEPSVFRPTEETRKL